MHLIKDNYSHCRWPCLYMCKSRSILDDMMVHLHLLRKTDGLEKVCQHNSNALRQATQVRCSITQRLLECCKQQRPLILPNVLITWLWQKTGHFGVIEPSRLSIGTNLKGAVAFTCFAVKVKRDYVCVFPSKAKSWLLLLLLDCWWVCSSCLLRIILSVLILFDRKLICNSYFGI